ncbi:MAG: hypothetical protein KAR12_01305, partial [Methylococcales bacterium]|nr:hypothetical protein [Methylococcales bacterium]
LPEIVESGQVFLVVCRSCESSSSHHEQNLSLFQAHFMLERTSPFSKPVHKGVGFDANTFVIYNIELVNLSY